MEDRSKGVDAVLVSTGQNRAWMIFLDFSRSFLLHFSRFSDSLGGIVNEGLWLYRPQDGVNDVGILCFFSALGPEVREMLGGVQNRSGVWLQQ